MAEKGCEFTGFSFGYKFRKTKPTKSIYKIDYRNFKSKEDFIDYCTLFEDSGWKHIYSSKHSGNQYFKNINHNSSDDIFSDNESKAGRYKRFADLSFTMAISYFPILVALIMTNAINLNAFINPKALYYTPGLWDKTGLSFLGSFLFETPFALGRGFFWLIFPTLILLYLYFTLKASRLYKSTIKQS